MLQSFQLLQHHEIDFAKWDNAITTAKNGRVYALSWYLNEMAPGWKALVLGDYETVLPLPVRKKWGIEYLFQPAFVQQLGLFSVHQDRSHLKLDTCLQLISKHFRYAEVIANSANFSEIHTATIRKNYLLSLHEDYANLQKAFSRSAKRNIEKARKAGISVKQTHSPYTVVKLHQQRYGTSLNNIDDYKAITKIFKKAVEKKTAFLLEAHNTQQEVIASSGYIHFKDRLVFLMNGNLPESLKNGATHLLKDYAIQQYAGQQVSIDFEGSDTPAFARFYEQYGAKSTDDYPCYTLNQLPFFLKWLKRDNK